MTSVAVVVVTYNARDSLRRCLRSIAQNTKDVAHRLVVVDNASTDGTGEFLRSWRGRSEALVLRNRRNAGKAGALNMIARGVDAEWYAVVDDDAVVPERWLRRLLDAALTAVPAPAVVGCRSLFPDGTICCAELMSWHESLGTTEKDLGQRDYVRFCDGVSSICALIKADALKTLRFDEGLSTFEDGDFCMQVRSRGLPVLYYGPVAVRHEHLGRLTPGLPPPYLEVHSKWGFPVFPDSHPIDRSYARACRAVKKGDARAVLRECRILLRLDRVSTDALWWSGVSLAKLGRAQDARRRFLSMLRKPYLSPWRRAKAELALQLLAGASTRGKSGLKTPGA